MSHRIAPPPAATARRGRGGTSAGFTLVELLVVLAIGGVLLAVAAPAYGDWIAAYQLRNHAEQLAGSMNLARSEAMRRGHRVNLCPAAAARRCAEADGWSEGWLVYVDADRDGRIGDDETVLRAEHAAIPGLRVQANRPVEAYVSFTALGSARLLNGGLQMGTFTVCRPGQRALRVVLANSGRVRLEQTRESCAA